MTLCAACVAALFVTTTAEATPVMVGAVLVVEHDTGFADAVDTPVIGSGIEIAHGDGSDIGDNVLLFDNEFIDISPTTVLFNIAAAGTPAGHTPGYVGNGYPDGDYRFENIQFSAPARITNVTYSSPGNTVADFGALALAFTDNSILLHLAGLGILGSSEADLGQLLLTVDIADTASVEQVETPEPASLILLGTGLAACWRTRKSKKHRSQ